MALHTNRCPYLAPTHFDAHPDDDGDNAGDYDAGDDSDNALWGWVYPLTDNISHHLFKWQVGQNKRHQGISKNILHCNAMHCFKELF